VYNHVVHFLFFRVSDEAGKDDHACWFFDDEMKEGAIDVDLVVASECRVKGDGDASSRGSLNSPRIDVQNSLKSRSSL